MSFLRLFIFMMVAIALLIRAPPATANTAEIMKVQSLPKQEMCTVNCTVLTPGIIKRQKLHNKCCIEEAKCALGLQAVKWEGNICYPNCYCEIEVPEKGPFKYPRDGEGVVSVRVPECDPKCTGANEYNFSDEAEKCCKVSGPKNCTYGSWLSCSTKSKGKVWCDCKV